MEFILYSRHKTSFLIILHYKGIVLSQMALVGREVVRSANVLVSFKHIDNDSFVPEVSVLRLGIPHFHALLVLYMRQVRLQLRHIMLHINYLNLFVFD